MIDKEKCMEIVQDAIDDVIKINKEHQQAISGIDTNKGFLLGILFVLMSECIGALVYVGFFL